MSQNKKILILTSTQNFSWFSMTEIIPRIESLWENIAYLNDYDVLKINVDKASVKEIISKGIQSDLLLVTCFNLQISRALKIIRTKVEVTAPIKFYVHGMATVGMWPLSYWEWDKLWQKNDSFLVSNSRDLNILKDKFKNINVELIPFTHESTEIDIEENIDHERKSFYYVGRISEQKNIHSLIYSFSKHVKVSPNSILTLFGSEDDLGSPNMGIATTEYMVTLYKLIRELSIEKSVCFKGFVDKGSIRNNIPSGHKIFVSISLHSDENFGMAVLEALSLGHNAIISNWGGYADFKNIFSEQVKLVDVETGDYGPYVQLNHFVALMNSSGNTHINNQEINFYTEESVSKRYRLNLFKESRHVCDFDFSKEIAKRKNSFSEKVDSSKIFRDYTDELYHYFSKKYARSENTQIPTGSIKALPWVDINNAEVNISDPHKGCFKLKSPWRNSREDYLKLLLIGYAFNE